MDEKNTIKNEAKDFAYGEIRKFILKFFGLPDKLAEINKKSLTEAKEQISETKRKYTKKDFIRVIKILAILYPLVGFLMFGAGEIGMRILFFFIAIYGLYGFITGKIYIKGDLGINSAKSGIVGKIYSLVFLIVGLLIAFGILPAPALQ